MNFSIVIPTYRRPDLLRRILSSIEQAERPPDLAEVVVVENGGRAGAAEVCAEFSARLPLKFVYEDPPGLSNARNVGARACTGDILLFFDDDIRVCAHTLSAYSAAFHRHGESAFYGGPLTPDYETTPEDWILDFLPPSARGFSLGSEEMTIPEPCLLGGNMAVPRKIFERVGGFDPISAKGTEGGGTGEEKRLQARLIDEGVRGLFIPDALVGHFVPANRCDVPFIRRRRWRRGYGFGQLYATKSVSGKTLLGAPRWWWSSSLGHLARYVKSSMTFRPRSDRLGSFLATAEAVGWIQGYRHQIAQQNAQATEKTPFTKSPRQD